MTRSPHDIRHGDRWATRAIVVASNDWPPPKPGTHESDLDVSPVWPYCSPGNNYEAASTEFRRAMRWSRAKAGDTHAPNREPA